MSNAAMTATFRHSRSTGAARLVLLAMADEANDEGYLTAYRRSQSHLAGKANVDKRTIGRAIDALVALGELVVIAPGLGREQSDYRLVLPGLGDPPGEGTPPTPPRGGRVGTPPTPRVGTPPTGVGTPPTPSSPSLPVDTPSGLQARGQLALVGAPTPAAQHPSQSDAVLGSDRDVFFVEFWASYPRRCGKGQARQAWARARRRGVPPEVMIQAARAYAADPNREPQFTRHPATWLNGEGWADEALPERLPEAPARGRSAMAGTMDALRRVAAGELTDRPPPDHHLPQLGTGR